VGLFLLAGIASANVELRAVSETLDEFNDENGILIADDNERAKEAKRLAEVEEEINAQNEAFAAGKANFGEKLYPFSDLAKEDFEKEKLGVSGWDPKRGDAAPERRAMGLTLPPESERINTPENQAKLEALYSALDRGYTPYKFNAKNNGWVTEAKNQGNCGSCAAFAATGLHETCMAKAGAPLGSLDLSEQYLVDCGYDGNSMNGCHGAWPSAYTEWFAKDGGMSPHETSYPYLDKYPKLNCNKASGVRKWNSGAKVIDSIYDWNCNEQKLKQLVYEKGAVLVGLYASDDDFMDYDGRGVMDKCSVGQKMNHAVLVVGYGRERGQDYWLIKNSWGTNWGLNGYIKLARGTNQCGLAAVCVSASCASNGRQEYAPTTPKPPPVPVNMWCDISGLFKGRKDITGTFNLRVNDRNTGSVIESEVRCKNSRCTPKIPGPSNACMYICGAVKC